MAVSQPCLLLTPNLCPPFLSMTAVTSAGPCSPNDGFQSILSLATLTLTWLFLYPTSITLPSWCGGMGQALGWAGGGNGEQADITDFRLSGAQRVCLGTEQECGHHTTPQILDK